MTADFDLDGARTRLSGRIHVTPIVSSRLLAREAGLDLVLKAECLQRAGSFKIRGALNFMVQLDAGAGRRGVVTGSSGNHGQAVALAAAEVGYPATIVVPEDIAAVKEAAIDGYGARVERCGLSSSERLARAAELAAAGATFVPPYDHEHIIAGQSTLAAELLEQAGPLDAIVVPVGGGGLLAGTALAVKREQPSTRVIGVETDAADDAACSFAGGERVSIDLPDTIADGIRNNQLGDLNWDVIRTHVDDIVTVSDDAVVEALRLVVTRTKMWVEPTGAVSVAAVLAGRVPGNRIAAVLSGGNVDPARLAQLLG